MVAFSRRGPWHIGIPTTTHAATRTSSSAAAPVLLFGWMNGSLKHLSKYAQFYLERGHPVAIALSSSNDFLGSGVLKSKYAGEESVAALETIGALNEPVIIHVFSNGGCFNLQALSHQLRKTTNTSSSTTTTTPIKVPPTDESPSRLRSKALILDSCPGRGGFTTLHPAARAFTVSIKNPLIRILARSALFAAFLIGAVWNRIWRIPDPIDRAARFVVTSAIGDGEVGGGLAGPRLFLYSRNDELISWRHVEHWMEFARSAGDVVRGRVFEISAHVAHMRTHEREYWREVETFLDKLE